MANLNVIYRIAADISGLQQGVDRAAKATEKLETMASRTGRVLTQAFAGVVTIGAVASFAKNLVQTADALVKVADQTGLTTGEVQKLQFIAEQSGNSIGQMTNAVGQLQRRLVGGSDSTVDAVRKLGLNFKALRDSSPFDQMAQIGSALAKIPDPAQRAALAVQLFGRAGVELLPTLIADFEALGNSVPVMSDKTVRALEQAGDAWNLFTRSLKVWTAESFNFAGRIFDELIANLHLMVAGFFQVTASVLDFTKKIPGGSRALKALGLDTDAMRVKGKAFAETGLYMRAKLNDVEVAARKAVPPVVDFGDAAGKAAKEAETLATAVAKIETSATVLTAGLALAHDQVVDTIDPMESLRLHVRAVEDAVVGLTAENFRLRDETGRLDTEWKTNLIPGAIEVSGRLADIENAGIATAESLEDLGESVEDTGKQFLAFKSGAADFGAALFDDILRAVQGGGDVLNTAMLSLGKQLGTAVAAGMKASGASAASISIASAIVTYGVSSIVESVKMFRAMMQSDLDRVGNAIKSIADIMKLAATIGVTSFEELTAAADRYGVSMAAVFASRGNERIVAMAEAVDTLLQKMAEIQGAVDGVGAAVTANFGIIPEALRPSIEALLEMKTLTEEQRKALENLLAGGSIDFDGLTKKAAEYGISLDNLGKGFQQKEISRKAQLIITDFENLIEAGADEMGVLDGMGDEVGELVMQAKRYGVALPESMRPIIEAMFAAGKLVDANGKKIESLAGINFEDSPLQKSTDAIVEAIDTLGELLTGIPSKARRAADGVPDNPFKKWKPPDMSTPDSAATGGLVTARGIQRFAGGGVVLPSWPMQPRGAFGVGAVPIIAHEGEVILNRAQQANLASQRSGQAITIGPFYIDGVFSEGDLEQTVRRQMVPIIARTIEDNVGGARTRFQEALG